VLSPPSSSFGGFSPITPIGLFFALEGLHDRRERAERKAHEAAATEKTSEASL